MYLFALKYYFSLNVQKLLNARYKEDLVLFSFIDFNNWRSFSSISL